MPYLRAVLATFLLLAAILPVRAQIYLNALIPDSLKTGAGAVIRDYSLMMQISSERQFTVKVHKAVTVLNKSGEPFSALEIYYDKFSIPGEISITVFEGENLSPRKARQSEIRDYAVDEVGTLFSDDRVKWFKPAVNIYPYTIVFDYEVIHNGYLSLPLFMPVSGYGLAVQKASVRVDFGTDSRPAIKELNFASYGIHSREDQKSYSCEVEDIPAIIDEPLSPDLRKVSPVVYFFPQKVEFDGSRGDFSNWNGFGNWQNDLLRDRDLLPEPTRQVVHQLTDTVAEVKTKARILYEYMQSRMRYVGIQLGIGGFQPFSAEIVDKTGYGDCKALSNYYKALLKEAGISSLYAITWLGDGKAFFLPEHTSNIYFNHVMVCVPIEKDTTWVECTNQFVPFGYVSSSSEGKPAILILNKGCCITNIRNRKPFPDKISRNSNMDLFPDGSVSGEMREVFSGIDMPEGLRYFIQSHKEQEDHLYKSLRLNNLDIVSFLYSYHKASHNVEMNCRFRCSKLGSVTANRLLLQGILPADIIGVPDNAEDRKLPVVIPEAMHEYDTLTFTLKDGIIPETLPKAIKLETKFGSFSIEYSSHEKVINIRSALQIFQAEYPKEDYRELRDFIIAIQKAQKQKILLKLS